MKEDYCLFIGRSNELPESTGKEDYDVLYCHEETIDKFQEELAKNNVEYLFLILYRTYDYVDTDMEYIKNEWKELTGATITMEFLSCNSRNIKKHLIEIFDSDEPNTVLFKAPFIGFRSKSDNGYIEAKKLILETSLEPKWKFWKW